MHLSVKSHFLDPIISAKNFPGNGSRVKFFPLLSGDIQEYLIQNISGHYSKYYRARNEAMPHIWFLDHKFTTPSKKYVFLYTV